MEAFSLRAKTALQQAFSSGLGMFWHELVSELPWNEQQYSQRQAGTDEFIHPDLMKSSFLLSFCLAAYKASVTFLMAVSMARSHTWYTKLHRIILNAVCVCVPMCFSLRFCSVLFQRDCLKLKFLLTKHKLNQTVFVWLVLKVSAQG